MRKRNETQKKNNSSRCGRGGFTLAELCVVMALVVILVAMIVSFSALMNKHAGDAAGEYAFLKDCARLKEAVCAWSAQNDTPDSAFTVESETLLVVKKAGDAQKAVSFADGILTLGDTTVSNLENIEGLSFSSSGSLIKCVIYRHTDNGDREDISFVFSLRCGTVKDTEDAVND